MGLQGLAHGGAARNLLAGCTWARPATRCGAGPVGEDADRQTGTLRPRRALRPDRRKACAQGADDREVPARAAHSADAGHGPPGTPRPSARGAPSGARALAEQRAGVRQYAWRSAGVVEHPRTVSGAGGTCGAAEAAVPRPPALRRLAADRPGRPGQGRRRPPPPLAAPDGGQVGDSGMLATGEGSVQPTS